VDDDYGGEAVAFVPTLAASVAKVSYPGLDLSHLYFNAMDRPKARVAR